MTERLYGYCEAAVAGRKLSFLFADRKGAGARSEIRGVEFVGCEE